MLANVLTPRGFLTYGGVVLLLLGIVGFITFNTQNTTFWLTTGENIAHVGLGLIALAIVFVPGLNDMLAPYYRWIVILLGIVALFFAVYGLVVMNQAPLNTFGLANLEIVDTVIHLVVGAWALYAAWRPAPAMEPMSATR
jgi:hypothetical protein